MRITLGISSLIEVIAIALIVLLALGLGFKAPGWLAREFPGTIWDPISHVTDPIGDVFFAFAFAPVVAILSLVLIALPGYVAGAMASSNEAISRLGGAMAGYALSTFLSTPEGVAQVIRVVASGYKSVLITRGNTIASLLMGLSTALFAFTLWGLSITMALMATVWAVRAYLATMELPTYAFAGRTRVSAAGVRLIAVLAAAAGLGYFLNSVITVPPIDRLADYLAIAREVMRP